MDEKPPQRQDPIAVAVLGCAVLLLIGLVLYVVLSKPAAPEKPGWIAELRGKLQPAPPKPQVSPARPQIAPTRPDAAKKPTAIPARPQPSAWVVPEAGRTWRYAVTVEPSVWRDVTLTYRSMREGDALVVLADFRHAGGQMDFRLGTFARGHPSHANVRFPGFFMHASYFEPPLEAGQRVSWEWPWQLAGGAVKNGRLKRFHGQVVRWENVQVPAGTYSAAVIETDLYYIDDGRAQAKAKETLWYAPKVSQVVKVVREGRVPDESVGRIVAELVEYR